MSKILNLNFIFKDNNPQSGLFFAKEVLGYDTSLDPSQRLKTIKVFKHLAKGHDVSISDVYTDRFGIDYVYVRVNYFRSTGKSKFKVIAFPNIALFVELLHEEQITFQYEELIESAKAIQEKLISDEDFTLTKSDSKMYKKSEVTN